MKLLIVLCALSLTLLPASPTIAGPFLVCDPHPPNQQITGFTGVLDGQPFATPIKMHTTGAEIIYDIATLDDGIHNFTEIRAVNIRGQSEPVPFVLPAVPTSSQHTRIAQ